MSCVFHKKADETKRREERTKGHRKYFDVDEIGRKTGYRLSLYSG